MLYQLQPYAGTQSRYRCPACNHSSKSFVRYINTETGQQLAPYVGRCGRQEKCAYHYKPKDYFKDEGYPMSTGRIHRKPATPVLKPFTAPVQQPPSFIDPQHVNRSFNNYHHNCFVQYLISRFGHDIANELVGRYRVGTSKHWPGATVFWQLDAQGFVRSGKIMLYNAATGKRVKEPFNHITWAHTLLWPRSNKPANTSVNTTANCQPPAANFILNQCLFGEHLLAGDPYKPVAIVESEKTAIIASVIIPKFTWLACGSLDGLNSDKCRVLQGREVMLFPDAGAFEKWTAKANQLRAAMPDTVILVSNVLERIASDEDRKNGIDIGDLAGW